MNRQAPREARRGSGGVGERPGASSVGLGGAARRAAGTSTWEREGEGAAAGRAREGARRAPGRREGGRGARLRGEKVLRPRAAPPGKLSRIPATAGPGGREAADPGDFGGTLIVERPEGVRAPGAELKALAAEAEKGGEAGKEVQRTGKAILRGERKVKGKESPGE